MVLPAMLVLFGALAQVLVTSQSRVHLEQAAYAAARSALAYKCPPMNVIATLRSSFATAVASECQLRRSQIDAIAQEKATDAARWALIAAAPTSSATRASGCPQVPAAEQILTGGDKIMGRDGAVSNALCYVYAPGNVTVTLEWQQSLLTQVAGRTRVPIRATVTFRYPLSTPFRRFVYDGKSGDLYWKTGTASVTLL